MIKHLIEMPPLRGGGRDACEAEGGHGFLQQMPARLVPGVEIARDNARPLVIMDGTDDLLDLPRESGGGNEVDGVNIEHQQGLTREGIAGDQERFGRRDQRLAIEGFDDAAGQGRDAAAGFWARRDAGTDTNILGHDPFKAAGEVKRLSNTAVQHRLLQENKLHARAHAGQVGHAALFARLEHIPADHLDRGAEIGR